MTMTLLTCRLRLARRVPHHRIRPELRPPPHRLHTPGRLNFTVSLKKYGVEEERQSMKIGCRIEMVTDFFAQWTYFIRAVSTINRAV